MRAVLDTNVIISAHLSPRGTPGRVLQLWRAGRFDAITSPELLDELREALKRPHLMALHHLDDSAIDELLDDLRTADGLVTPTEHLSAVPADPDDSKVVECAVAGGADVIVTGDKKHLLPLGSYAGIPIVAPADFLAMLDSP